VGVAGAQAESRRLDNKIAQKEIGPEM